MQDDTYFLTLLKYVERNPVRARLAKKCADWKWGSAWRRVHGSSKERSLLDESPVSLPRNYEQWINMLDIEKDLNILRDSVQKGRPFGTSSWVDRMVQKYELESTLRDPGRPKGI